MNVNPLVMMPRMIVPITVPAIRPMPPDRLVPPITAAAIASSSYDMPIPACPLAARADVTTPPSPDSSPATV